MTDLLTNPPTPAPMNPDAAEWAQLTAQLDDVRTSLAVCREQLAQARQIHRSDIALISERLTEEANDRGWCGEYDEILANLNRALSIELTPRTRDYCVTVPVTIYACVYVSARDEDDAAEQARDSIDISEALTMSLDNGAHGEADWSSVEVEES